MSSVSKEDSSRRTGDAAALWTSVILGLAVFLLGIVMLFKVFGWAYDVFQGIDGTLSTVQVAAPVRTAPSTAGPSQASGESSSTSSDKSSSAGPTVGAKPGAAGVLVAAGLIVTKLLGLVALGWIAALIASRGAEMVRAGLSARPT